MSFYILLHHHRHGVTPYTFQSDSKLTVDDCKPYVEDYEDDRDDESLEFFEDEPQVI